MRTPQNIIGNRYGSLTVISKHHYDQNRYTWFYLCKCDCGKEVIKRSDYLKKCVICSPNCKLNSKLKNFKRGINNPNFDNAKITLNCKCGHIRTDYRSNFTDASLKEYKCHKCKAESICGKEHPRYKNGNYSKTTEIGRSNKLRIRNHTQEYRNWRKEVLAKDRYMCQICFSNGHGLEGKLEAHHLIPWADIMVKNNIDSLESMKNCKELWDINNGVTFCKSCHSDVHFIAKEYGEVK